MARTPDRTDTEVWLTGKSEDGRLIEVLISREQVRLMIDKAKRNKTGRSVDGPVTVKLSNR